MREDSDALRLFLSQRGELVRYAANLTGERSAAEDVVQEAWVRFAGVARVRLLDEPKRYLYRIVRNLALDHRRRKAREQLLVDDNGVDHALNVPTDAPSSEVQAQARSDLNRVRDILRTLPDRMRIAFEMHRLQDARLVDIAAHLGISKSAAHELVVDALERCRTALRQH